MGEYARYNGESIKIGTCEDMYYLRADQALSVSAEDGSVDPLGEYAGPIRFRFPFPDEDDVEPGAFDRYDRGIGIEHVSAPEDLAGEHYTVQFVAQSHGYNVCLPCPEDGEAGHGLTVHRNGFAGATFLVQQRLVDGRLLPILRCACGMSWRVEDPADLLESLEATAIASVRRENISRRHHGQPELEAGAPVFERRIAERVLQGFDREYVAGLGFGVRA